MNIKVVKKSLARWICCLGCGAQETVVERE